MNSPLQLGSRPQLPAASSSVQPAYPKKSSEHARLTVTGMKVVHEDVNIKVGPSLGFPSILPVTLAHLLSYWRRLNERPQAIFSKFNPSPKVN